MPHSRPRIPARDPDLDLDPSRNGSGSESRRTFHTTPIRGVARILYPHHPLYGQELEVFGALGGLRSIYYVRMPNGTGRGVPAWMFDEAICSRIRSASHPSIDCRALLKLAELLDQQGEGRVRGGNETTSDQGHPMARATKRTKTKAAASGRNGAKAATRDSTKMRNAVRHASASGRGQRNVAVERRES
jgi:hypothetical protein